MGRIKSKSLTLSNGQRVTIRNPELNDAAVLIKNVHLMIDDGEGQVVSEGEFNLTVEQEEAWIKKHLTQPLYFCVVAEIDGRIMGIFNANAIPKLTMAHDVVCGMGLLPSARGLGIGGHLMATFIDWVHATPEILRVSLEVLANNHRAIGLYEKFHFEEEGRKRNAVRLSDGTFVDSILMSRLFSQ